MHNAHQRLARRQASHHLLAEGLLLHAAHELLHHGQRDVRLEQRHAHLAQCVLDVVLGEPGLAAQVLDDGGKALGEVSSMRREPSAGARRRPPRVRDGLV